MVRTVRYGPGMFSYASYAFHHGYLGCHTMDHKRVSFPSPTTQSRHRRPGKVGESARRLPQIPPRGKFRTSAANVHLVAMMLPLPLACLDPQERSNLRLSSAEARKGFFSLLYMVRMIKSNSSLQS